MPDFRDFLSVRRVCLSVLCIKLTCYVIASVFESISVGEGVLCPRMFDLRTAQQAEQKAACHLTVEDKPLAVYVEVTEGVDVPVAGEQT